MSLYGRYAAGIGDYVCNPECLHLAVVITDQYGGVTLIDGQPSPFRLVSRQMSEFQTDSVFSVELSVPEGMSARAFASALRANANAYTPVLYSVPYLPSGFLPANEYNSNSFASGLLRSVSGSVPSVSFGKYQAPGWNNPVPRQNFGGAN